MSVLDHSRWQLGVARIYERFKAEGHWIGGIEYVEKPSAPRKEEGRCILRPPLLVDIPSCRHKHSHGRAESEHVIDLEVEVRPLPCLVRHFLPKHQLLDVPRPRPRPLRRRCVGLVLQDVERDDGAEGVTEERHLPRKVWVLLLVHRHLLVQQPRYRHDDPLPVERRPVIEHIQERVVYDGSQRGHSRQGDILQCLLRRAREVVP
mmetsp:Transcript_55956/g.137150  ORF Transcript_55956/g.137150 Transcript_55956/m.137150 type:complete len:205 (+) Transcript_55956:277-891(+)